MPGSSVSHIMIAKATQANNPPRSPRSEPRLSAEEDIDGKTEGRGNKVAPELTRAVTTDVLLQLAVKSSSGNQKKGKFDDVDSLECLDIESLPHLPTSMAVSIYKCQGRPPASIYMLPAGIHSSGVCTSLNPLKLHVRCPVIACMQPLSSGTSSTGWTRMATASSMLTSSCHAPRTWYETLNAEPALCHSMRMYTVPMLALWHIGNLH